MPTINVSEPPPYGTPAYQAWEQDLPVKISSFLEVPVKVEIWYSYNGSTPIPEIRVQTGWTPHYTRNILVIRQVENGWEFDERAFRWQSIGISTYSAHHPTINDFLLEIEDRWGDYLRDRLLLHRERSERRVEARARAREEGRPEAVAELNQKLSAIVSMDKNNLWVSQVHVFNWTNSQQPQTVVHDRGYHSKVMGEVLEGLLPPLKALIPGYIICSNTKLGAITLSKKDDTDQGFILFLETTGLSIWRRRGIELYPMELEFDPENFWLDLEAFLCLPAPIGPGVWTVRNGSSSQGKIITFIPYENIRRKLRTKLTPSGLSCRWEPMLPGLMVTRRGAGSIIMWIRFESNGIVALFKGNQRIMDPHQGLWTPGNISWQAFNVQIRDTYHGPWEVDPFYEWLHPLIQEALPQDILTGM